MNKKLIRKYARLYDSFNYTSANFYNRKNLVTASKVNKIGIDIITAGVYDMVLKDLIIATNIDPLTIKPDQHYKLFGKAPPGYFYNFTTKKCELKSPETYVKWRKWILDNVKSPTIDITEYGDILDKYNFAEMPKPQDPESINLLEELEKFGPSVLEKVDEYRRTANSVKEARDMVIDVKDAASWVYDKAGFGKKKPFEQETKAKTVVDETVDEHAGQLGLSAQTEKKFKKGVWQTIKDFFARFFSVAKNVKDFLIDKSKSAWELLKSLKDFIKKNSLWLFSEIKNLYNTYIKPYKARKIVAISVFSVIMLYVLYKIIVRIINNIKKRKLLKENMIQQPQFA